MPSDSQKPLEFRLKFVVEKTSSVCLRTKGERSNNGSVDKGCSLFRVSVVFKEITYLSKA